MLNKSKYRNVNLNMELLCFKRFSEGKSMCIYKSRHKSFLVQS